VQVDVMLDCVQFLTSSNSTHKVFKGKQERSIRIVEGVFVCVFLGH
jgi:hypothetical protein